MNAVTAEQALAVARRYIVPDRLVVIAVGDRSAIEAELRKLNLGAVEIRDVEGRPPPFPRCSRGLHRLAGSDLIKSDLNSRICQRLPRGFPGHRSLSSI